MINCRLLYEELHDLTGFDMALPMNSGAEAVETAIKAARKWGYKVKGIPDGKAEIIVCANNFHGRTTTVISFSSDEQYRDGFGPFTPGFKIIPFGDADALRNAITPNTCAFLVEPIQGEAGIIIPPDGIPEACRRDLPEEPCAVDTSSSTPTTRGSTSRYARRSFRSSSCRSR